MFGSDENKIKDMGACQTGIYFISSVHFQTSECLVTRTLSNLTMRYRLCKGFVRKVFVFFTRVNVECYSLISEANTIRTHAFGQLLVAYSHNGAGGGCSVKDVLNTIFVIEAYVLVIKIQSH